MYLKKIVSKSLSLGPFPILLVLVLLAEQVKAGEHNLTFAVSGVVSSVKVKIGDEVKVGTILAVLDLTPFNAAKRSSEAATDLAKFIFTLSKVRLEHAQKLFDALSTSGEELEKAKIEYAKALSGYKIAKSHAEIAIWQLRQATLKAPFIGIVSAIPGYPGMVINNNGISQPVVVVNKK